MITRVTMRIGMGMVMFSRYEMLRASKHCPGLG